MVIWNGNAINVPTLANLGFKEPRDELETLKTQYQLQTIPSRSVESLGEDQSEKLFIQQNLLDKEAKIKLRVKESFGIWITSNSDLKSAFSFPTILQFHVKQCNTEDPSRVSRNFHRNRWNHLPLDPSLHKKPFQDWLHSAGELCWSSISVLQVSWSSWRYYQFFDGS